MKKDYTIAVAGTGYVGLSIATLLSQHHKVMAVDIVKEKVDLINNRKSPIQDNLVCSLLGRQLKKYKIFVLPGVYRATQKFYIFLIVYLTGCTPIILKNI